MREVLPGGFLGGWGEIRAPRLRSPTIRRRLPPNIFPGIFSSTFLSFESGVRVFGSLSSEPWVGILLRVLCASSLYYAMAEEERTVHDRNFKLNLAGEGAPMLRERIKEKLKEFMGDYTDDTLVEYVIVLLRNGRSKDEAKRELNVFLGDDSDTFVSWLWDHLSLNLHVHVQPKEFIPDGVDSSKVAGIDEFGRSGSRIFSAAGASHNDSEHEREKTVNVFRNRRNREFKGPVGEETRSFPLRSTIVDVLHSKEKTSHGPGIRNSSPSTHQFSRKRRQAEEMEPTKKVTDSLLKLAPPRRLLEFAVRDAVKTVQQSSSRTEPSVKRLRSIVSTSMDTGLDERPQRPRSTMILPGSVSVALKAAAEAAEDVKRSRHVVSVFDRLGDGEPTVEPIYQSSDLRQSVVVDGQCGKFDRIAKSDQMDCDEKNEYDGDFDGNTSILDRDADMATDSVSDNNEYDNFGISGGGDLGCSQSAYTANKEDNSLMVHYSVSKETDAVVKKTRLLQQDAPASASGKPSSKILNISVNVNTWKPPDYQASSNANEGEKKLTGGNKNEERTIAQNIQLLKDNSTVMTKTHKEMASSDLQKVGQKSQSSTPGGVSYTTSRPSENIDSRTIFVSNVHFAATKDTLSRHFNKFGEVLKVIIVIDPATGQPIGSAYVEFLRKESAELALSLNGTSFMSRILKVVRSSSAEASMIGWPRVARPSTFTPRLGRMRFPRGLIPGAFRPRLSVKPGAKSLQWKRETAPTAAGATGVHTGRNLTYIRPDSKT
ncbi:Glycine-rich RNA-binding protein 5, mitochondrial [Apostasia shenzhenica]|uniref:Glycine-rich RNA-binding protein 5, mitochondrial n=1 Tax=Apostasia shenzhenica TaxID=1088818 RepID=A0A2H9ZVJ0_9ASPA|nr:Glycine-rich RNA-binding protein 5, mitochondrial [Apostasia shenzhenica]